MRLRRTHTHIYIYGRLRMCARVHVCSVAILYVLSFSWGLCAPVDFLLFFSLPEVLFRQRRRDISSLFYDDYNTHTHIYIDTYRRYRCYNIIYLRREKPFVINTFFFSLPVWSVRYNNVIYDSARLFISASENRSLYCVCGNV